MARMVKAATFTMHFFRIRIDTEAATGYNFSKGLFISLSLLRLYTNNAYIATCNYIQMQYMVHITTVQHKDILHKCPKTQQNKESLCN